MFNKILTTVARMAFKFGVLCNKDESFKTLLKFSEEKGLRLFGYKRIGATEYVRPLNCNTWFKVRGK